MCYQVKAPYILYLVSHVLQAISSQLPLGLHHSCVSTHDT